MLLEVRAGSRGVADAGADFIAACANDAIKERGIFTLALSGGSTPWAMMVSLAKRNIDWEKVYLYQVDERIAPLDHPDRNMTRMTENLIDHIPLPVSNIYPMPVDMVDMDIAVRNYCDDLEALAGSPAILDLVHLGLGTDGHTASLVPGDPVLDVTDFDVSTTDTYQGRQRMTLTYPILNRARQIMFLVTGDEKVTMIERMLNSDSTIPAGKLNLYRATIFTDIKSVKNISH